MRHALFDIWSWVLRHCASRSISIVVLYAEALMVPSLASMLKLFENIQIVLPIISRHWNHLDNVCYSQTHGRDSHEDVHGVPLVFRFLYSNGIIFFMISWHPNYFKFWLKSPQTSPTPQTITIDNFRCSPRKHHCKWIVLCFPILTCVVPTLIFRKPHIWSVLISPDIWYRWAKGYPGFVNPFNIVSLQFDSPLRRCN